MLESEHCCEGPASCAGLNVPRIERRHRCTRCRRARLRAMSRELTNLVGVGGAM
jgi:hypothetical protein